MVIIALGAARAKQLIVREIGEPQMTDAAIRINGSLFSDQIASASMAHRPFSLSSGLSYEDCVAVAVSTFLASQPRRETKNGLPFAEARRESTPVQPIDMTAAPALA
ncbi:hypothetical protein NKY46_02830 [Sinorhizobium meliloti]|uniref:hypothetical protein n=1 Tax=Rhizobium meliloti TaxID=382 RepID=UPI0018658DA6